MQPAEIALLLAGGTLAGIVNTLAGGGSLLTVPLLLMLGLPGGVANGTNRVGTLLQSAVATWRFRAEGVSMLREGAALCVPLLAGSALGALAISRLSDATFERLFAWLRAPSHRAHPRARRGCCSSRSAATAAPSRRASASRCWPRSRAPASTSCARTRSR
jgi:hypothetical protein